MKNINKTMINYQLVIAIAFGGLTLTSFASNTGANPASSAGTPSSAQIEDIDAFLPADNTAAENDDVYEYYYRDGNNWVKIEANESTRKEVAVVYYVIYLFLKNDHVLYNTITNEDINVTLEINDMQGKRVYSPPTSLYLKKGMNEAELPVKMLAEGNYTVNVYNDKIKVVKKIFVQ